MQHQNTRFPLVAMAIVLASPAAPALAAAGTDCICRSADNQRFESRTLRHSRWACDVKLGYLPSAESQPDAPRRPQVQTCNLEEVHQFKVWLCLENGCTYGYVKSQKSPNKQLERIEPLKGERRP